MSSCGIVVGSMEAEISYEIYRKSCRNAVEGGGGDDDDVVESVDLNRSYDLDVLGWNKRRAAVLAPPTIITGNSKMITAQESQQPAAKRVKLSAPAATGGGGGGAAAPTKPIFLKGLDGKLIRISGKTAVLKRVAATADIDAQAQQQKKTATAATQTDPAAHDPEKLCGRCQRAVGGAGSARATPLDPTLLFDIDLSDFNDIQSLDAAPFASNGHQTTGIPQHQHASVGKTVWNYVQPPPPPPPLPLPLDRPSASNGRNGNWQMALFKDLANCSKTDNNGFCPIHIAVINNNEKAVFRQLLVLKLRKIHVDIETTQHMTPLLLAVKYSCKKVIVEMLHFAGATLNVADPQGNNIVHLVVINSSPEVLGYLLDKYVNVHTIINDFNYNGETALIIAAKSNSVAMAELLLQKGAHANLQDKTSGRTALFYAVESNYVEMTKLLMNYGGNPKVCNFNGVSITDSLLEISCSDEILECIVGKHWYTVRRQMTIARNTAKQSLGIFPPSLPTKHVVKPFDMVVNPRINNPNPPVVTANATNCGAASASSSNNRASRHV